MAKLKKFEIEWSEDSNKEFENMFEDDSSKKEIEFADLLEGEELNFEERSFQVGDKVKGRIIQITSTEDVFVDIGSKIPATIAKKDLFDEASQKLTKRKVIQSTLLLFPKQWIVFFFQTHFLIR